MVFGGFREKKCKNCVCCGGQCERTACVTLDRIKVGSGGTIQSVGGDPALRKRLLDMGLTPRTQIMVRKIAPLGDPIEVHLRNYELTLRKADAGQIKVLTDEENR